MMQPLRSLLRNLFRQRRVEQDLEDELRAYVDELTLEKRAEGMDETEARRAALMETGGVEQVKEEVRQGRAGQLLREFLQDVRYGARALRKNRAFSLVAVLALALGIGANSAMFSMAYGLLLRPLPYAGSDRVAAVYLRYFPRDFAFGTLCVRDFQIWQQDNHVFEEPSLFRGLRMDIGGKEGAAEQVQGASVTAGFFHTLELRPAIGRTLNAAEDKPGSASLAVLGERIWRRRFGGSPGVLGQTILVNGAPATVIGVMPAAFQLPRPETEIWTNLILNPPTRYGPWFYRGVARLKPGVTLEQAQAEMKNIAAHMMRENPTYQRLALPVLSLRDAVLGSSLRPAMLVLAGAVGLVLLIAVVNVANLMLARATVREREMALRLSLGASRGRLVRQLLAESVVLAMLGGAAGLGLAWCGIELVRVWNPGNFPLLEAVRLDVRALGFTILVSGLTGILFGLVPALESARAALNQTIKEGGRGGTSSRTRNRTRSALVVCEIAVSLILLVGAGLLLRSLRNLQQVDGGFRTAPRRILTMLVSPGNRKYNDAAAGLALYEEVLRRVRRVPGVETAAVTDSLPPDRQGDADTFQLEGQALAPGELNPIVTHATVGPDFYRALGIPLRKGRYFTEHDTAGAAPVMMVSEGFARRFLSNGEAVGKRVGYDGTFREVVGVVGDVKYLGLAADTDAAYYLPFAQSYSARNFLVIRSSGEDAARFTSAIRESILSVDTGLTLAFAQTMEQAITQSVSQPRFDTLLLGLFAGMALLLAGVGIYGLMAYSVAQRTHEIGVRMALGAARGDVVRMVVRQGAALAAVGVFLGIAGAFGLTRLLRGMLFGVGVTDGFTFAAAPVGLVLIVLLASLVPALRATRISPVAALRHE